MRRGQTDLIYFKNKKKKIKALRKKIFKFGKVTLPQGPGRGPKGLDSDNLTLLTDLGPLRRLALRVYGERGPGSGFLSIQHSSWDQDPEEWPLRGASIQHAVAI